jgi:hypothetical protein
MRRIILFLLIFTLLLTSCSGRSVIKNDSEASINTEHSVDKTEYILVTSMQRYHTENCSLLYVYEESERVKSSDLEFIKACGYVPCRYCLPYM